MAEKNSAENNSETFFYLDFSSMYSNDYVSCIKLQKMNRVEQRADAERGEGEKKTKGKKKREKMGPNKNMHSNTNK